MLRSLPGGRPLVGVLAVVLLFAVFAAQLVAGTHSAVVLSVYALPLALVALEFGVVGGLGAALLALALAAIWSEMHGQPVEPLGYVALAISFGAVVVAVGYVATQMRRAHQGERRLLERAADGIVRVGADGLIGYANAHAEQIFGYESGELLGRPVELLVPEDLRAAHGGHRAAFLADPRPRAMGSGMRLAGRRKDGSSLPIDVSISPLETEHGTVVTAVVRDLLERQHARVEIESRDRQFRAVFQESKDAILVADDQHRLVDANPAACELLGRPREQILHQTFDQLMPAPGEPGQADGRPAFDGSGAMQGEYRLGRPDGSVRDVEFSTTANFLPGRHLAVLRDVTERKRSEERIAYLAYHDDVTGLANRALFQEHLEFALARARRRRLSLAILYLDLDRFKLVNDTLGHAAGDQLLREIGARLAAVTRAEDLVARHSGDEFLLLLGDLQPAEAPCVAERTATHVHGELRKPFVVEGHEFFVDASIGIGVFPDHAADAEALLRHADLAMYEGKRDGRGGTRLYGQRADDAGQELSLANRLRTAAEREEFVLHYQPLVELGSGRVQGAEALIRWRTAGGELVLPADFIPAAEETGLIAPICDWVIAEVCRQARLWQDQGLALCVSFNLSARQLHDGDVVERILAGAAGAGANPQRLMVEVTESAAAADPERTRAIATSLRESGLHLALDDFGAGHSSLSRLREMGPVDVLKIDRTFVRDLPSDAGARTLVSGITAIASGLGIRPLAEGIETEAQRRFLLETGCGHGQGFHFSRPVPATEIAALAAGQRQLPEPGRDPVCATLLPTGAS